MGGEARAPSGGDRAAEKLESLVAALDEVVEHSNIGEVTRRLARGFVEIGAIMCIIMVADERQLRVVARWPEAEADALYARTQGGALTDFTVPLHDTDNPYCRVYTTQQPKLMHGPDEVADHILATYRLPASARPGVAQTLTGKSGAVLPLIVGDRAVGVVGINYSEDLGEGERHLFNIFAHGAATLINFRRETVGRAAILHDLEQALERERAARAELNRSERLAALGEMSAVVAHDIRTPLAAIKNAAASLRRFVVGTAEEGRLLCDIVDEETRRIERIINDMLIFSAPMDQTGERVVVADLVHKALFLVGERTMGEDSRPSVDMPDEELLLLADPHRVTQALVNLLVNAREAAGSDGRVALQVQQVTEDDRPWVRFTISDDGPGVDPDLLDGIYEPFFTTKATGTGLGLAIVKRVVDAHGGQIAMSPGEDGGTVVDMDLPAAT